MLRINDQSLRGRFGKELTSVDQKVEIGRVVIPEDYPDKPDREIIDKLKRDFLEVGIRSGIAVTKGPERGICLVFGLQRLLAARELCQEGMDTGNDDLRDRFNLIKATIYTEDKITPEMIERLHISENLIRKEISPGDRKKLNHRYGELLRETACKGEGALSKKREKLSEQKEEKAQTENLFKEWYESVNMPRPTAQREWNAAKEAGIVICAPSKATTEDMLAFHAWGQDKEEEAQKMAQEKREKEATKELTALVKKYGKEMLADILEKLP